MSDKTRIDRRSFLRMVGAAAAVGVTPIKAIASAATGTRITIVGGGVAGTRAAIQLKQKSPALKVSLVDPMIDSHERHQSKINYVLDLDSSSALASYGIDVIAQKVNAIDAVKRRVLLETGLVLESDILVIAPGVEFKTRPFTTNSIHPLNQVQLLQQVSLMREGGTIVVGIPRAPYQYPQGPYIQVNKMLAYLQPNNPAAKILVFDQNGGSALSEDYRRQWESGSSASLVELIPVEENYIHSAEPTMGRIETVDGFIDADVIAIMPQQQAAAIARSAGLANNSDWCLVNSHTYESVYHSRVYVLGDANDAVPHEKTALIATQQADQFVRNILTELG